MHHNFSSLSVFSLVLVAVTGLLATGCAPARAQVQVSGLQVMNQNELGESAPVKLRLYPLRSDAKFRATSGDSLWTGDEELLRADLTHAPTVTLVSPGGTDRTPTRIEVPLGEGAKWLGVLALYVKSDAIDRRTLVLPIEDADRMIITCSGYSITAEKVQK